MKVKDYLLMYGILGTIVGGVLASIYVQVWLNPILDLIL